MTEIEKETLLDEYSDEIARVIVKMYDEVKNREDDLYHKDYEAWCKESHRFSGQRCILLELMIELENKFPEHMRPSNIMVMEGVTE